MSSKLGLMVRKVDDGFVSGRIHRLVEQVLAEIPDGGEGLGKKHGNVHRGRPQAGVTKEKKPEAEGEEDFWAKVMAGYIRGHRRDTENDRLGNANPPWILEFGSTS